MKTVSKNCLRLIRLISTICQLWFWKQVRVVVGLLPALSCVPTCLYSFRRLDRFPCHDGNTKQEICHVSSQAQHGEYCVSLLSELIGSICK